MKTPTINSRILKLEVLKGTATRTSVNAVESRTTSLESDVATAKSDISTLQTDVSTVEGDISTLQGNVTTLTQGIVDAVSTHNTAPDSHADIRTLVAGKQDSLTISDVGEAMLAIATPSGQKIPRVNADGSVVLINVPSGDGVGGSSWYASDDGPPSVAISLSWVSNGDTNGVFRALGTESGTWSNPASSGRIRSLASSIYAGADAVELLTDRKTTSTTTNDVANSWFAFDLGVGTTLALDSYSLQGRGKDLNHQLRTWVIEGSNDVPDWTSVGISAATWTTIDSRTGDPTISGAGVWGHWAASVRSAPYRFIRIRQTGANSYGAYHLALSEVELYGLVSESVAKPAGAPGWARNSELIDDATAWMPYYATSALTDGTPIFGTAYDVASAVSTHNTSPDSHADIRTLIADRALIEHQHARTDLPWVTYPGAALLTAETVDAQRTALGMTAWAVAPWTDGTTSDVPEGSQLYFTVDRANTCADARIAAQKGQADGLAPLDAGSKVPSAYLPDSVTSFNGRTGAILPIASDYSSFYLGLGAQAADSAKLGGVAASEYSQTSHTHAFSSLTSKPTTLAGYGITDAAAASHAHTQDSISSAAGWITDALAGKQPTIAAGTTAQYYRGDKTFQDFAASVRAAILTGLNTSKLSSREVLSTDSLLSAIGLLQGQLTSIVEQNYYAQAGDTKLEIPLSYTGTGTGVLTLRLLSDIAQTATIDGAGKFYTDAAGTLNESTSFAMSANAWTTFYIKVPSGTCNVTIPNGYAIRAFGNSANPLVAETNNGPKINGLSTSKIRGSSQSIYSYAQLGLSVISGSTYPWLNATQVLFSGSALTISGTTYPWINATQVFFSGNALTISGATYPWVNAVAVYFGGNALTITANISTSALYSGSGSFDLYINGTGISTTYATSRAWPANISRIYLRPSVGSMPSADVDRLFIDLDATPGLTAVVSKVLDLRGNCGAVTAASATARANLAAKGFTVSFNV